MSDEYESQLLGAILLRPEIYPEVQIDERHFLLPNARRTWRNIKACVVNGIEPNISDVVGQESQENRSNDWAYYVASLTSNVPSATNWKIYQKKIIDAYKRRKLREIAESLEMKAKDVSEDVDKAISDLEERIAEIFVESGTDDIHSMGDVMIEATELIEKRYQTSGELPGITSGFHRLDSHLMGFQDSMFYIIGGRPSSGKSALALTMARHQATKKKAKVGYISLESSRSETGIRALAQESKINSNQLITGLLSAERDFRKLVDSASLINSSSWHIYDRANATLDQVKSAARRMVVLHGATIIYIDYLQLIEGQQKDETRFDHVSKVSRHLKQLARDLNVPVVAIAQLNRDKENKRPTASNLKESGQLEQDADAIMLLWRQNKEDEMRSGAELWGVTLIVEKCRDGKVGDIQMSFMAPYVLFTEQERV